MSRLSLYRKKIDSSDGQVAISTVAVFMIIFAILVVSFTGIMISSSHETVSDELHSSARAAAESGIEDAKRMLSYCYKHRNNEGNYDSDVVYSACSKIIGKFASDSGDVEGQKCNTIIDAMKAVGFYGSDTVTSEGRVKLTKDNGDNNSKRDQTYQCLKIATLTKTYEADLKVNGKSQIIPLRFVNRQNEVKQAKEITLRWHATANKIDGKVIGLLPGDTFTNQPLWMSKGSNRPAVLRLEFAFVPKDQINIYQLSKDARAVTLRPSSDGGTNVNMQDYPTDIMPNRMSAALTKLKCQEGDRNIYACEAKLYNGDGLFGWIDGKIWLKIQSIYRNSHFEVSAKDENGDDLYFDGIQPQVDVTGRDVDAYERLQARLDPAASKDNTDSSYWWPDYAIDTAGRVCKNMVVRYDDGDDKCN